jgi:hydrogenase expression/formation protein HypC
MCLAVPAKIIEIYEANGLKMGKLDFGGVLREACLAYVPEAEVGQYGIVHVGFVLNLVDEADAQETLRMLGEMAALAPLEDTERYE